MRYTDLHCDTAYNIYKTNSKLAANDKHISLEKTANFEKYAQIFAVWSEHDLDDDTAYSRFFKVRENFIRELSENNITLSKKGEEYQHSVENNKYTAILAVEGGKLIGGDIARVDELYKNDVRFLTLVWGDNCKIGGAFNAEEGLTQFGKDVVKRCEQLGIIVDVSHSSEKMFYDVLDVSTKPFVATHSNSFTVRNHQRNLKDEQFKKIVKTGGIVGISLANIHIAEEGKDNVSAVMKHIEHYLSLGGENSLCFGFDLDGSTLVNGIDNIADIEKFEVEMLNLGYKQDLIEKIFHKNADDFIIKNL